MQVGSLVHDGCLKKLGSLLLIGCLEKGGYAASCLRPSLASLS